MARLLTKPLPDLTAADIDEFCELQALKSEMVELNEVVPHKDKRSDPWSAANLRLSDYAKRELVKEVVALANSHGGHLLLGIAETEEDPPKA